MSVAENAVLNAALLRALSPARLLHAGRASAPRRRRWSTRYAIKAGGLDAPARSLSGGNMQKLIVARALALAAARAGRRQPDPRPRHRRRRRRCTPRFDAALARGAAVLLISTDLDEIVAPSASRRACSTAAG